MFIDKHKSELKVYTRCTRLIYKSDAVVHTCSYRIYHKNELPKL